MATTTAGWSLLVPVDESQSPDAAPAADSTKLSLIFSAIHPLNAVIRDAGTGRALYETSTPRKLKISGRHTTIRRVGADAAEGPVVAELVWRALFSPPKTVLKYGGEEHEMAAYLARESIWNYNRTFMAPDGKRYQWKHGGCGGRFGWQLVEEESGTMLAESRKTKLGVFSKPTDLTLTVFAPVLPFLDLVLITFIFQEYLMQVRQKRGGG